MWQSRRNEREWGQQTKMSLGGDDERARGDPVQQSHLEQEMGWAPAHRLTDITRLTYQGKMPHLG